MRESSGGLKPSPSDGNVPACSLERKPRLHAKVNPRYHSTKDLDRLGHKTQQVRSPQVVFIAGFFDIISIELSSSLVSNKIERLNFHLKIVREGDSEWKPGTSRQSGEMDEANKT